MVEDCHWRIYGAKGNLFKLEKIPVFDVVILYATNVYLECIEKIINETIQDSTTRKSVLLENSPCRLCTDRIQNTSKVILMCYV